MGSLRRPSVTDADGSILGLTSSVSRPTSRPGGLGAPPLRYLGGSRCGRRRAGPSASRSSSCGYSELRGPGATLLLAVPVGRVWSAFAMEGWASPGGLGVCALALGAAGVSVLPRFRAGRQRPPRPAATSVPCLRSHLLSFARFSCGLLSSATPCQQRCVDAALARRSGVGWAPVPEWRLSSVRPVVSATAQVCFFVTWTLCSNCNNQQTRPFLLEALGGSTRAVLCRLVDSVFCV